MNILSYPHDSYSLIQKIWPFLGSDEWQKEHKQTLRRQQGKIFYLLINDNSILISFCSIYKNQILDVHTVDNFRCKGYGNFLINKVANIKPYLYAGSANTYMQKILIKNNFKYYLSRGKYKYYERKNNISMS